MTAQFRPRFPWWGADLQTLRNRLAYRPKPLPGERDRFRAKTPDGDTLTGTLHRPVAPKKQPLVCMFHGLTGDEDSIYMLEATRHHLDHGRNVLRMNLRGAGSSQPLCKGTYTGASWPDILTAIKTLEPSETQNGIFLIGFSMGGNMLLNALPHITEGIGCIGAATVSAPIDPASASRRLMDRRNSIYQNALLKEMKAAYLARPEGSDPVWRSTIENVDSVWAFDDQITAAMNGYRDAQDYYDSTAGIQWLESISLPLLTIHAKNDPWIPIAPYLNLSAPPNMTLEITRSGGHVGFHGKDPQPWHDLRISDFIADLM